MPEPGERGAQRRHRRRGERRSRRRLRRRPRGRAPSAARGRGAAPPWSASSSRRAGSSRWAAATSGARTAASTCSRAPASGSNPAPPRIPDPGGYGLYEYRVLGTYREPRAFGLERRRHGRRGRRAGDPLELQLSPAQRERRPHPALRRGTVTVAARYSCRLHERLRGSVRARGRPADRPALPAGSALDGVRVRRMGHARRPHRAHARALGGASSWTSRHGRSDRRSAIAKSFTQVFVYRQVPEPRAWCSPEAPGSDSRPGFPARCRSWTRMGTPFSTRTATRSCDGEGPAVERALLRGRRHDRARLHARSPR